MLKIIARKIPFLLALRFSHHEWLTLLKLMMVYCWTQYTVGSRSTSGDTDEGELRAGSIEVRVIGECHTTQYGDVSYTN